MSVSEKNLKWKSKERTMRASKVGFDNTYWGEGLRDAIASFNRNPSRFRYRSRIEGGSVGIGNGQNEIWWSDESAVLNGAPARAHYSYKCYWFFGKHVYLKEVDIAFDVDRLWSADTWKFRLLRYGGKRRLFQSTAVHELGHGLVLGHENRWYNVMGADYTHIHANGRVARGYLGEDAANGAIFLYGGRGDEWERRRCSALEI